MTTDRRPSIRRFDLEALLLAAVIALSLLASVLTVARYTMPHVDDAVMASIDLNLYHERRLAWDVVGDLYGFDRADARVGRLFPVVQGAWLLVFGPTFTSLRASAVAGEVLLALLVFWVGARLFDRRTGLLSAAVLLVGPRLFGASHIGRQEIWVMVGSVAVLAYYLTVRGRPTRLRCFFLGLLTLVPVQFHLNGIWFMLPVALLVTADNLRTGPGRWNVAAFGAGGVVAAGLTAVLQLAPDPALALGQLSAANGLHNAELAASLPARLGSQANLLLYGWLAFLPGPSFGLPVLAVAALNVLFLGLAVIRLAFRRAASDRVLLVMWGVSYLAFAVGMPHKNYFYAALWDPFAALLIGAAFGQPLPGRFSPMNGRLLAAPLLVAGLILQGWLAYRLLPYDFGRYARQVRSSVPADAVVVGDGELWFALRADNRFYAESYFAMWGCSQPGAVGRAELAGQVRRLGIEYVIFDGILPTEAECANPITPATARAYAALLDDRCAPVASIPGPTYRGGRYPAQGETTTVYHCPDFAAPR